LAVSLGAGEALAVGLLSGKASHFRISKLMKANQLISIENVIHIAIALWIPIVINIYALMMEVGITTLEKSMFGKYYRFGLPCNPWEEILPYVVIILSILIVIVWGIDKAFTTYFINSQKSIIRIGIIVIISLLGSISLYIGTIFLSMTWLIAFNDYIIGMPMTMYVIIPAIFIQTPMLFILFALSGIRRKN
jgi:hypothetical protein